MTDPRLLVAGHRKFHNGQLREAAAAYFEYVGNAALSMRESVLRQHTVDAEGAHQTFKDLQQAITRLEDIYDTLGKSAVALPPTGSITEGNTGETEPTVDSSSRRTQETAEPTGRLPPIPLSDLSRLLIVRTYAATMATQQRKAQIGKVDTAQARRLMEEEQIGREDLDKLSMHLQAVEALGMAAWDVCAIAREIARIDTQLFMRVQMPEDMVVRSRETRSGESEVDVAGSVRNCAGFAVFLGHAVAGILLDTAASAAKGLSASLAPPSTRSPTTTPRRSMESEHRDRHALPSLTNLKGHPHVITCLVVLAHMLVRVFADFNGGIAVLWALTLPEIRRLQSLWKPVDRRTMELLGQLCDMAGMQSASVGCPPLGPSVSADEANRRLHTIDETRYHDALKTAAAEVRTRYTSNPLDLHSQTEKSLVVAIPYIPRSVNNLRRLYGMYTMSVGGSQVLLSAPGAQLLDKEKRVFGWCRIHSSIKPASPSPHDLRLRSRQHTYEPRIYTVEVGDHVYQMCMPVTLSELIDAECSMESVRPHTPSISQTCAAQLSVRDASLQHWILTRPFFATGLIRSASVRIQTPLAAEAGIFLERSESSESEAVLQSSSATPNIARTMAAPPSALSEPTTFTGHLAARDNDQRDVESDSGSIQLQVPLNAYRIGNEESEVSSQQDDIYADNVDAEQLPSVDDFLGQFLANEHIEIDENGVPDYLQSSAPVFPQGGSFKEVQEDEGEYEAGDVLDSVNERSDTESDDSDSVSSSSSGSSSGSGGLSDLDLPSVPVTVEPKDDDAREEARSADSAGASVSDEEDSKRAAEQDISQVTDKADSVPSKTEQEPSSSLDEISTGSSIDQHEAPAEAPTDQDEKSVESSPTQDENKKESEPAEDTENPNTPPAADDTGCDDGNGDAESTASKYEDAGESAAVSFNTFTQPKPDSDTKRPDHL